MANTLDFNAVKKEYLNVTLPDENKTLIMVCTPTKALLQELLSVEDKFKNSETSDNSLDQVLGELYELIARIMSRNKGGIVITKERLESCLDFEDLIIFFKSYIAFVQKVKLGKN